MTNAEIIAELPNKNAYYKKIRSLKDEVLRLAKEQDRLERTVEYLSNVDLIHKGIAITHACSEQEFCRVEDRVYRRARFYLNQHDQKTWGVSVKADGDPTDLLVGFFATMERAKELCLDFVAGTMSSVEFNCQVAKERL